MLVLNIYYTNLKSYFDTALSLSIKNQAVAMETATYRCTLSAVYLHERDSINVAFWRTTRRRCGATLEESTHYIPLSITVDHRSRRGVLYRNRRILPYSRFYTQVKNLARGSVPYLFIVLLKADKCVKTHLPCKACTV